MKAVFGFPRLAPRQGIKAPDGTIRPTGGALATLQRALAGKANAALSLAVVWWPFWICAVGIPMFLRTLPARLDATLQRKTKAPRRDQPSRGRHGTAHEHRQYDIQRDGRND
jgi:hypothetical protein